MKDEMVVHRKPHGARVELLVDGQSASWTDLPYYRMRLGRAVLSVGGVAGVFTKPEHRMKGYSSRVLRRCVKVMTADGLDVSLLFGIPNYYHKFGYRTALADYEFAVAARTLIDGPMKLAARGLPKDRHAEILPLYRQWLAASSFGLERRSGLWRGFSRGLRGSVNVTVTAFYRGRRMVGYVACDQAADAVRVPELVALDAAARRSIFTWLARQCREKLCENIQFGLPHDDPASRLAREFGGTFTQVVKANAGGMMRVLNLPSTLEALRPELAALWSQSALGSRRLSLVLKTDLGRGKLSLPGARPSAQVLRGQAKIPQDRLIQFISGYLRAADAADLPGVEIPRRLVPVLDALFPTRCNNVLSTNCF